MTEETFPDIHHDPYSKTVFGFWVYLLTDFILFGTLFAVYAVLKNKTFGGPTSQDLFVLSFSFIQALLMLTCAFTSGVAGAYAHRGRPKMVTLFLLITFGLGASFFGMQIAEFSRIIALGHTWKESAFLSAYYTLVGTHAFHMIFALIWIFVFLIPIWREGISEVSLRRVTCLRMFWQFLNIIWVFIFTFVYLMGVN